MATALKPTTLLIDGDMLAVVCAFAAEERFEFEPELWTWWADENAARNYAIDTAQRLMEHLNATDFEVALTDKREVNWRKALWPAYKEQRTVMGVRPPLVLPRLREWMADEMAAHVWPGLEADDILGILATRKGAPKRIICSQDKDFRSVPGWFYPDVRPQDTPAATRKAVERITKAQADRWHMYQTLVGDTADNYPGCPGIGPAGASEMLDEGLKFEPYEHTFTKGARKGETELRYQKVPSGSHWETVVSAFERAEKTKHDALVQARIARILRVDEYNPKDGKVHLWNPPKGESA